MLKVINESSVKAGRNLNVYFDKLPIKDDGTMYPVTLHFTHNDVEVRTEIALNGEGATMLLDMSFEEFAVLPTYGEFREKVQEVIAST